MRIKVLLLLTLIAYGVRGQETFPSNGALIKDDRLYVLRGATVHVDPVTTKSKADVFVQNGKIIKVTQGESIPRNAIVKDMSGKHIYPSFIELYSSYGLPDGKKEEHRGPMYERKDAGAPAWHASVHPEKSASQLFMQNSGRAEEMRKAGFGVSLSHQMDGIVRGTAVLAALSDEKNNISILKEDAALFFSFDKGLTAQDYAGSKMGAIALMRQTFYDAQWYAATNGKEELNASLEAINKTANLPRFLVTEEKNDILRGKKIADEFGFRFAFVGSGNEFERVQDIKSAGALVILPLDFPAAMDMNDPYTSRYVGLRKLRTWEIAPANAAYLAGAGVEIALTMNGLKDAATFWKNLRRAMNEGLTESQALNALTLSPAKALGMEALIGTLRDGSLADFLVMDAPMKEDQAKLIEHWVQGKSYVVQSADATDITGEYDLKIEGRKFTLSVLEGDKAFIRGDRSADTSKVKVDLKEFDRQVNMSFKVKDQGLYRLHGNLNNRLNLWEGTGINADGETVLWHAVKLKEAEKITAQPKEDPVMKSAILHYPNHGQGWTEAPRSENVVFRNATVWTNTDSGIMKDCDVLVQNGKIIAVGHNLNIEDVFPKDRNRPSFNSIEAYGKHITSGIIDEHSHIAITGGVNEGGQASSAEVRIGDVIDPEDQDIYYQLAGGVTAAQLLHGSANPIGGQSALIKLRWGSNAEEMKIQGAAGFIKFALGENVKQSNWGNEYTSRFPQTRMGVEQLYYDHFHRARDYRASQVSMLAGRQKERNKGGMGSLRKDLEMEALSEILESKRFITCHSYVQSEINMLMHVADSMGFRVNTFTHILEGYKVADKMKKHGAGASTFSDWWAYKFEVREAIPYNAALMSAQGITVAINSDDAEMGRRLNQEAAKGVKYGGMSEEEAWKMVTLNPAKLLHLDERMGKVAAGMDADIVMWSDNPLSIYALVEKTYVDGVCYYDRELDQKNMKEMALERAKIIERMAGEDGKDKKKPSADDKHRYHCDHEGH
jgi:imidazolonepropionase-like amidohydrolase